MHEATGQVCCSFRFYCSCLTCLAKSSVDGGTPSAWQLCMAHLQQPMLPLLPGV